MSNGLTVTEREVLRCLLLAKYFIEAPGLGLGEEAYADLATRYFLFSALSALEHKFELYRAGLTVERKCGNCKFFEKGIREGCTFDPVVPDSFYYPDEKGIAEGSGKDCPTFEPKETTP